MKLSSPSFRLLKAPAATLMAGQSASHCCPFALSRMSKQPVILEPTFVFSVQPLVVLLLLSPPNLTICNIFSRQIETRFSPCESRLKHTEEQLDVLLVHLPHKKPINGSSVDAFSLRPTLRLYLPGLSRWSERCRLSHRLW